MESGTCHFPKTVAADTIDEVMLSAMKFLSVLKIKFNNIKSYRQNKELKASAMGRSPCTVCSKKKQVPYIGD